MVVMALRNVRRADSRPRTRSRRRCNRNTCPACAARARRAAQSRAQPAPAQGIIDDADILGEQLRAETILEEAGLARDRGAIDRADEVADQRARHARIEHHGHLAGLGLVGIGARDGALGRDPADAFR